jgi:hypothetical protein
MDNASYSGSQIASQSTSSQDAPYTQFWVELLLHWLLVKQQLNLIAASAGAAETTPRARTVNRIAVALSSWSRSWRDMTLLLGLGNNVSKP